MASQESFTNPPPTHQALFGVYQKKHLDDPQDFLGTYSVD